MAQKRYCVALVPFYERDGEYFFFLQRRGVDTPYSPGRIGIFGGGVEDEETLEEALRREMKEELELDLPDSVQFFSRYEFRGMINNVFYLDVDDSFADSVVVHEGDGGLFISEKDLRSNELVVENALVTLTQLAQFLREETTI